VLSVNGYGQDTLWVSVYCCLIHRSYKTHAPYCIVICGLSDSTITFHIISQKTRFSFKKPVMCAWILSATCLKYSYFSF